MVNVIMRFDYTKLMIFHKCILSIKKYNLIKQCPISATDYLRLIAKKYWNIFLSDPPCEEAD